MRALVISGGGSKGAFGGGVAQYLMQEMGKDYDMLVGTSTGSLLVPHLALQNIEKIKEVYTSVNQNAIFNVCPFVIKKDKFGEQSRRAQRSSPLGKKSCCGCCGGPNGVARLARSYVADVAAGPAE